MPFKNGIQTKVAGIPEAHARQLPPVDETHDMGVPDGAEFEVMDPEVQPDEQGNYPEGTKVVAVYRFQRAKDAAWLPPKRTRARKAKNGTVETVPAAPAAPAPAPTAGKK